jgi:hypothetical protein
MTNLRVAAILVAVGAAAASATGCGYSPNPESGTLKCGSGDSCPEGYKCGLSGACWRTEDKPEPLIGCWLFEPNSVQQIGCTDGSSDTLDLSTVSDFVEITAGAISPLATDYYCLWKLFLHGQSTAVEPGQTCTLSDPATGDKFIHRAERFSFSLTSATRAQLELSLPFDYETTTSGNGSCTLRTSGTLTKGVAANCTLVAAPTPSKT